MTVKNKNLSGREIIDLWQKINNTNEIDYKAISKFAKDHKLVKIQPLSVEEQIEQRLREAVKRATYIDPQGRKVRIFGIPRVIFEGELLTLSPVDMRVTKPDIAKTVQDANFEGIGNDVKRHSVETESYNENNPYGATLPFYNYDFNHLAEQARIDGQYDDSFDEDDFNEDNSEDEQE